MGHALRTHPEVLTRVRGGRAHTVRTSEITGRDTGGSLGRRGGAPTVFGTIKGTGTCSTSADSRLTHLFPSACAYYITGPKHWLRPLPPPLPEVHY
ncbi:hypothetical protein BHE74_00023963 [Ensete ventricosum]|nr:hypothetical protein BHE74_00023963 [Ensete ventricosum]RZS02514.1 hypothetical protein BHM03_00032583 [Ensete ventricosum]